MKIGISADNTLPIDVSSFASFIAAHSKLISCHKMAGIPRFRETTINFDTELSKLSAAIKMEIKSNDISLLLTSIPFDNNYFYSGVDNTYILSFSDWHLLTSLPISNGLAYILCQILLKYKMGIGRNHDESTGCINDFFWDKTMIDVGMRAAFLCEQCREYSSHNQNINSREFAEIDSILNTLSLACRRGIDILAELPTAAASPNAAEERFDVFLCHNSKDKLGVRVLNEALRNAGLKTWFDEEQIRPGELWQDKLEAQIANIAACLIVVGDSGIGPWQDMERRAFISEFAGKGTKIIPVLTGNSSAVPQLPLFLKQFMWSDLRNDDGRQLAKIIATLKT